MVASRYLDVQVGEQPSDGADRVHNSQVMGDERGEQDRLPMPNPAHTSAGSRQGQRTSAAHPVPTILGRGNNEHPSVRVDVEAVARLPTQRTQNGLRGHPAAAGWDSHPQQKLRGIDNRR
ncbi:hypothetical protein [Micromonospora sp. NPDC050495]|uniref:hypothetical protein n=1 Tax=Micromonospora sp. NPDC050495 TaxID=3154936 RepID=UPI0033EE045B